MTADKPETDGDATSYPLVSIIIPCFNSERFLAAAIDSALNQTYPNTEIIVVDDASSDRSTAVMERFAGRIRIERMTENRGPSAARNLGISLASGEFIQFLDADDVLHPDKIFACFAAYEPGVDWVIGQNAYFRDGEPPSQAGRSLVDRMVELTRQRVMEWDPERVREYVLRREVQTAAPLHRTSELVESGGFREELWSLEDIELHFRLAHRARHVRKVERVLVYCRHHGSPTRLRTREGRFTVALEALDHIHAVASSAGPIPPELRSALADRYANLGRKLLWRGFDAEGRKAIAVAQELAPRPNPTGVPLYNMIARWVGLERMERTGLAIDGGIRGLVRVLSGPSHRWQRGGRGPESPTKGAGKA